MNCKGMKRDGSEDEPVSGSGRICAEDLHGRPPL